MKKQILLLIGFLLMVSGCGKSTAAPIESTTLMSPSDQIEDSSDSTESIALEEEIIELTIPKEYVEVRQSDEYSVTPNPDGSATYRLTLSQHEQLLSELQTETETELQSLMKNIVTFTSVNHDECYQSFVIETTSTDLSFREASSMITLFYIGGRYNAYAGDLDAVIYLNYTHSGEIIFSCDSTQIR